MKITISVSILSALIGSAGAFSTSLSPASARKASAFTSSSLSSSSVNRRDALLQSASACILGLTSGSVVVNAEEVGDAVEAVVEAPAMGSSPDHPIVVLGAGGRCGLLCTQILAKKGS